MGIMWTSDPEFFRRVPRLGRLFQAQCRETNLLRSTMEVIRPKSFYISTTLQATEAQPLGTSEYKGGNSTCTMPPSVCLTNSTSCSLRTGERLLSSVVGVAALGEGSLLPVVGPIGDEAC